MAIIDDLLSELDGSVEGFNSSLNVIQSDVLANVELLIKDITLNNGNIVQNVQNLQKLNKINQQLKGVVIPPEYKKRVIEFGKSFNTVTKIQGEYFTAMMEDYTVPSIIAEMKNLAISDTAAALTAQGLDVAITNRISLIIQNNINTGSKYTDLVKQLSTFIKGDKDNLGAYEKHVGQITTDAINTYAANYNQIVTDDLGLEWGMYVGALVGDSRELCEHLVAKKYVHKSELALIVKGDIDGKQIPIYKKTGLPYGMIPGTNANNFPSRRGGYKCNHLLMPILESRVPIEIRNKINKTAKATA